MTIQTDDKAPATPATEIVVDETANFEVVTSDAPVTTPPADSGEASDDKPKGDEEKPATDEKPAASGENGEKSGENSTAEQPKKKGVQKRIDKVVREREEAKRGREKAEAELKDLKAKQAKTDVKPADETQPEPKEADFESYDLYLDALDKHDQEKTASESAKPAANTDQKPKEDNSKGSQLTDAQKTAHGVLKEKFDTDRDDFEDFDKIALSKELTVTPEMLEALAECDDPSKVMYHLGKNKDLAAEIADKSPTQVMREITKLDLSVERKPTKPIKTTSSAEPITPVGSADASEKKESEMSFKEFEAHRNRQERQGNQ